MLPIRCAHKEIFSSSMFLRSSLSTQIALLVNYLYGAWMRNIDSTKQIKPATESQENNEVKFFRQL